MTTSNKKKRYTTKSKNSAPISWHWHISWFIYMTFCFKHLSQLLDEISSIPSEVVGLQNQPVVSSPVLGTSRVSILRFENSRFDLRTPKIDCLVHQGCESPALREKSVKSNGVRMSTQKKGPQNLPEKPKQVERSPLFRGCPHFQIPIFGLNLC